MNKDFYKILGVTEDASKDEIKKIYRRLAKKFHPDRNPGNKRAEARFKKITEAYETLSDDTKRQEYDMMRKYGAFAGGPQGGSPDGFAGFDFGNLMRGARGGGRSFQFNNLSDIGGLEEILNAMFSGGGRRRAEPFSDSAASHGFPGGQKVRRGGDTVTGIILTFMEAVRGTTKILRLADGSNKIRVRIPAGIEDGGKIRLKGQGQPGLYGGRNGDLIITVRVMPDKNFERKGNDIYSSVEISFIEAIRGCKKNVKTLARTVSLTIPPGTQPGTKMRLKGMGLAVGDKTGDQYVEIKVTIPTTLTENQQRLLDEWEG